MASSSKICLANHTSPVSGAKSLSLIFLSPQNHSPRSLSIENQQNATQRRRFDVSLVSAKSQPLRPVLAALSGSQVANSFPSRNKAYTVGDFMTRKENLLVVKPTTTVEEALETLVEKKISGFPVVDDDWKLVGVVSDYDLLALDSVSGGGSQCDTNIFPNVDSSWKTFNEIQRLLIKTNGKVVGDLMTPSPLVVREATNLEDAAKLLLETKYRRLPVVDGDGKLVGLITRGGVVRAALQIKRAVSN